MNEPIVYAIVAMVCYGLSDFIYKRAAEAGMRADRFLAGQGWIFLPLVTLYALATHRLVLVPAALSGSVAGLFIFVGFYFFIRSLSTGAVSTNASIFRMNFVVTVFLVIVLLGEPLTTAKIAGVTLALLATWLLIGGGDTAAGAAPEARHRSLIQVAIATVAFGASTFFHTLGLRHGALPETLAVAQGALFTPLAMTLVYAADRSLAGPVATLKYSAATAIALFGATIFLLHGIVIGQASILVPIAQMGFIVTALLGVFVLREPMTTRKAIGLVAAVAALGVLAAS
jgi:drug/metabolite transporter (DMT)-like permease